MQVETAGTAQFRQLGKKFRQASNGKTVRAELTKAIKALLAEGVRDVQHEVERIQVKSSRGGGSRSRAAHHLSSHKRAHRGGHGLRASVARSVKSRVKYTGYTVGARIYLDASAMPPDQRSLPKHLNDPAGWRHPTYGHDPWVKQVGAPYFEPPLRRLTPRVRAGVVVAVDKAMKELQR